MYYLLYYFVGIEAVRYLEPDDEPLFSATSMNLSSSKKSADLRRRELLTYLRGPLTTLCVRYCERLARSHFGNKVLEAVARVLHPRPVLDAIARIVVGEKPVLESGDDEEDEDGNGHEGDEEGEDEDDEMDNEEADGGNAGGEEEEDDDDDEDKIEGGEVEDEEEQNNELLAELEENIDVEEEEKANAAVGNGQPAGGKAGKQGESKDKVKEIEKVLPIEEDSAVHVLLKRLLHFEAALEAEETHPDTALWAHPHRYPVKVDNTKKGKRKRAEEKVDESSDSSVSLAGQILQYLKEKGAALVPQWVQKNRACFTLVELLKVRSVAKDLHEVLQVHKSLINQVADKNKGGKILQEAIESQN